ncbi:50S ribosomal protein L11 methyltransferase [Lentilactobacillus kefiri]|uniref:Ribosomal protein L11 methyltransferase n=2 Tax=Lentilactobacillus kefiri TaxID=33962 RepID=A0A8E1RIV0_LENKE|nr:50S ribosomal protein L11 methyltransferase [Lentilactobacillus kefiri]KRL56738.1 50S ribosomal protein L11 [Lentilactobacillus parakefiri DSM 10551]KRM50762.1 50S ribosomal protein L11 [Lentilactobacillus kefiri DSM 20587 = JCM 5818]MCJ2160742.1 50S ribosomal protein L11 methyltransferase [Lentilactobacillus kefiri]MCP9367997.1 50S ribosomal protein L11 methyltransferase [Lentilactobacillus kefiri]MDH5107453.1 50S ribosomal protein L11 methyltransferase [Lentilactobacillus kefiri]
MDWTELSIMTTSEAVEAVSNILMEHGASGVSIEDAKDFEKLKPGRYGDHGEIVDPADLTHITQGAVVSAYYPNNQHIDQEAEEIAHKVRNLSQFGLNPGPAEVNITSVVNQDWQTAWEKYYHPVSISRFMTIVPSWEDYQPKSDQEKILRLDPGMAFGTGTHPTTRLSLQALEIVMQGGESILDVGTGSGVLSIAAKLMGAGKIHAFDVDDIAVRSAEKNIQLNPAAKDIQVSANDLLKGIHEQVDIVVANILAEIIVPLVPQAWQNLKPQGYFLTSGIIKDKFETVRDSMTQQGFLIIETLRMKDWYGIIAQKPKDED